MTEKPYAPDIAKIADDLRSDHLHIDSAVAQAITPDQLTQIAATVEGSGTPMFVLAVPMGFDADLSPIQLVSLIHRQLPEDGVYFVARPSGQDGWRLDSTSYGVVTENANALAGYVAEELYPADLGLQLQKATELMASGTARQEYDKVFPDVHSSTTTSTVESDPPPQILGMDLPVAGLGLALIIAVIVAVIRRRKPEDKGLAVTGRALRRISSAQTQDWRHRAENETVALGERINGLQINDDSDAEAWSAALDYYAGATRVLDRSENAADSIGALVLARHGDDALTHAVSGKPWTPTAVCFFNPLHGAANTKTRWKTAAGSRDVPCCSVCRGAARRRREPDFLDLPVGDTVVHYIDSEAEPWASTGYGSLEPDLLARL